MLTPEEKAARADARKQAREDAKEQARIDALAGQKPINSVVITVEWKKSRVWGYNPHATGQVSYKDGTGRRVGPFTCSGTGYDKLSTVVADVFNAVLSYKLIGKPLTAPAGMRLPSDSKAPYGMYYYSGKCPLTSYEDRDGKKKHYRKIPQYNGGVGISCYPDIARFIGGEFIQIASGDSFDVFEYRESEDKP